jgi:hypothetical protein
MNKLAKCILFLILVILLTGVNATAQEVPKLRIDPAQAYGGNVSDYFDSIEYIPLETTKKSLFGESARMILTDSSIVISDNDTRAVLFFSNSGRYLSKVQFSQSILNIPSADYDKTNNIIIVGYYNEVKQKRENSFYSITGKLLSLDSVTKKNIVYNYYLSLNNGYSLKTNSCIFLTTEKPRDTVHYAIDVYKGSKLYKSFLPYNPKYDMAICGLVGYMSIGRVVNETAYYCVPLRYLVYRVSKDTVTKMFQFVFPANRSLPERIINSKKLETIDSVNHALWGDSRIILNVSDIFFNNRSLFFHLIPRRYIYTEGSDEINQYNFIYDTISHKLVSLERMSPDTKSYYLSFFDERGSISGLSYDHGYFYTSISSLEMFSAKEATKSKYPQYPPVLQEYFSTQNRKANPVIVKMKLKDL